VTLSGGQRQRLALARAFLTNPRILILDDSTSAVDSATEDQIQQAIIRAAANQTTILITHRLSQIRWADLVVVMRKGRVEAVGTHEQLMAQSHQMRTGGSLISMRRLGGRVVPADWLIATRVEYFVYGIPADLSGCPSV
jgi:ABC-type bacteriocin/lantibiotic exporter with double-glycine peptidase domain